LEGGVGNGDVWAGRAHPGGRKCCCFPDEGEIIEHAVINGSLLASVIVLAMLGKTKMRVFFPSALFLLLVWLASPV
jgi:hypothetical protein